MRFSSMNSGKTMVFTMKYGMLMDFHGFFCQSSDRINRDMISNNASLRLFFASLESWLGITRLRVGCVLQQTLRILFVFFWWHISINNSGDYIMFLFGMMRIH